MLKLYALLMFCCSPLLADNGQVFSIDRSTDSNIELSFPNQKQIKPKKSNFKLINYILLSNDKGQRKAVVTLKNLSTENRIFDNKQLLGLFANGARKSPSAYKQSFKGGETLSFTISFGSNNYPILGIYSSN